MKTKRVLMLGACIVILLFGACEKVIDLQLDNAGPVLVIDGGLSDLNEIQTVRISKTYSFTEANRFNGVSGAEVNLTDEAENVLNFTEVSSGVYKSPQFKGRYGVKYILNVTYENKTYTASSVMPQKVVLDSLTFREFSIFGSSKTYVAANYKDPAGTANQYRYLLVAKGKLEKDMVSEDRFDDGNNVANVIFYEIDDLVHNDTIDVELQCIDRNVYRYFYSLGQNDGDGGPPVAPANPPSNFNNNALGIFSAYTSSKRSVVIK